MFLEVKANALGSDISIVFLSSSSYLDCIRDYILQFDCSYIKKMQFNPLPEKKG